MKKITKVLSTSLMLLFAINGCVGAISTIESKEAELSEQYKIWMELSDEEKEMTVQPARYEIKNTITNNTYLAGLANPFKLEMLTSSASLSSYDYRNIIPESLSVSNQASTSLCWAFAGINALETTLALSDYKSAGVAGKYDFSEKHMGYGSRSNLFNNNEVNIYGVNSELNTGGTHADVLNYLSNGMGAVKESALPFVDSEENIDLADIQNKTVETTLYDAVLFESSVYGESNFESVKAEMKQHISTYGGIYAAIHGAQIYSDYYNNETGAIYCPSNASVTLNHAITIIGWDDNYSKDNFSSECKPTSNGAWIIENSWGTGMELTMEEGKQLVYDSLKDSYGWTNVSQVTDQTTIDILVYNTYIYDESNSKFTKNMGDDGYMYVSYEDKFVCTNMLGYQKVVDQKDYEEIYQNNTVSGLYNVYTFTKNSDTETVYLANTFKRTKTEIEKIDRVNVEVHEDYLDCKVYISNSSSKDYSDLVEVTLASGDTVDLGPGFNTIEFASPVLVSGSEFTVVLEVGKTLNSKIYIPLEMYTDNITAIEINQGESFYTYGDFIKTNAWLDAGDGGMFSNGTVCNFTIKAVSSGEVRELSDIEVMTNPTKLNYKAGESFDKTGMVVNAIYEDGSKVTITNYTVTNGSNLVEGTTYVTISYTEGGTTKTVNQPITVSAADTSVEEADKEEEKEEENYIYTADFMSSELMLIIKDEVEVELTISNILMNAKALENNEYAIYLQSKQGQTDIDEDYWMSVNNSDFTLTSTGIYTLNLEFEISELKNYDEITVGDELYIYIREISDAGTSITSMNTWNEDESDTNEDLTVEEEGKEEEDDTVATSKLPSTGIVSKVILISCGVCGVVLYINKKRIANIDK